MHARLSAIASEGPVGQRSRCRTRAAVRRSVWLFLVCAQLAAAHDDACGVRAELKASREQRVKEGQELQARMAETRRELSQAPTLVQRP